MSDFDALRAMFPDTSFAVYAYKPGQPVTLEAIEPTGETHTLTGNSLREILSALLPPADVTELDIFK